MEGLLTISIWALMSYWCYTIALKNGRDKTLAAIWGVLLGIFAVIIYSLLGSTEVKKLENARKLVKENENKKVE